MQLVCLIKIKESQKEELFYQGRNVRHLQVQQNSTKDVYFNDKMRN